MSKMVVTTELEVVDARHTPFSNPKIDISREK